MKMAEHDYETRDTKCSVRLLKLLDDTIVDATDYKQQPRDFDKLQFEMFDIARASNLSYVACREAVEWTCKLIFALEDVGVNHTLETLQRLRMDMFDDIHPLEIRSDIILHLQAVFNKEDVNDAFIVDCIEQFIKVFSVKDAHNNIVYL